MKQRNININIEFEGVLHRLSVYENEYRSLMHLITDKFYTEAYGECGGMGRCGTCTIEQMDVLETVEYQRNEQSTLQRLNIKPGWRLACQFNIDADLDSCTFRVIQ